MLFFGKHRAHGNALVTSFLQNAIFRILEIRQNVGLLWQTVKILIKGCKQGLHCLQRQKRKVEAWIPCASFLARRWPQHN